MKENKLVVETRSTAAVGPRVFTTLGQGAYHVICTSRSIFNYNINLDPRSRSEELKTCTSLQNGLLRAIDSTSAELAPKKLAVTDFHLKTCQIK